MKIKCPPGFIGFILLLWASATMAQSHNEDWITYIKSIDSETASVSIDLGLGTIAPITEKHQLLWYRLDLSELQSNGFPTESEFQKLYEIEDSVFQKVNENADFIRIGVVVSNKGYQEVYFMGNDNSDKVQREMSRIIRTYDYNYNYGIDPDTTWSAYFDLLFPDAYTYQKIYNERYIEDLLAEGDRLTQARLIDHFLYFKSEDDRYEFIQRLGDDFNVVSQKAAFDKKYPYELHISKIDRVDPASIQTVTDQLVELAEALHARYDGWDTYVIR